MRPFFLIGTFSIVVGVLLGGCRHYEPVANEEVTFIAIVPVINEAEVPQIIAPLSRNLRERLNHSPSWQIVEEASADAVLQVTVTRRERDAVARDPEDTGRPLSYYETIYVKLEWISEEAPPWGNDPVTRVEVDTLIYAQPGRVASESVAMTEMANDLARKIVARLEWPL